MYYVSLVPATLGKRGIVLEDFDGGPYTDMSDFNPLCECVPGLVCHVDMGGDGHFLTLGSENLVQTHLAHGDCRQEDAMKTGTGADLTSCVCL